MLFRFQGSIRHRAKWARLTFSSPQSNHPPKRCPPAWQIALAKRVAKCKQLLQSQRFASERKIEIRMRLYTLPVSFAPNNSRSECKKLVMRRALTYQCANSREAMFRQHRLILLLHEVHAIVHCAEAQAPRRKLERHSPDRRQKRRRFARATTIEACRPETAQTPRQC